MPVIDKERILNDDPSKQLVIQYNALKQDYTQANAAEYQKYYMHKPLSFIIENSRYIFSEPYFGYRFYKLNIIMNDNAFLFTDYRNEAQKVSDYLDEFGSQMSDAQKNMYVDLVKCINTAADNTRNTAVILSGIQNSDDEDTYEEIREIVYYKSNMKYLDDDEPDDESDIDCDDLIEAIEEIKTPDLFFAITPYIANAFSFIGNSVALNGVIGKRTHKFFKEYSGENADEDDWKVFMRAIIIVSKLFHDSKYRNAVGSFPLELKFIFHGLAHESVKGQINELFIKRVDPNVTESANLYVSPRASVNQIFMDNLFYESENVNAQKTFQEHTKLKDIALDILFEYVYNDYLNCDDPSRNIEGYNYFSEDVSVEEALNSLIEERSGDPNLVVRSRGTSMREEHLPTGKQKKSSDSENGYDNDDEDNEDDSDLDASDSSEVSADSEPDEDEVTNDDNKKSTEKDHVSNSAASSVDPKDLKPHTDNLANKIQYKAMDKNAKKLKKSAEREKKKNDIKGAAKAVTAAPLNLLRSIKRHGEDFQSWDDNRRKMAIVKPGYRSKVFRNLKLAILYGGAAEVSLSLVPVTFMARHFSKKKNVRIRRELAHELDTEIEVVNEKINDASAAGDQKQKYKLMRIKGKLEQDALRVKANSSFI
jgi:hypothetical protein